MRAEVLLDEDHGRNPRDGRGKPAGIAGRGEVIIEGERKIIMIRVTSICFGIVLFAGCSEQASQVTDGDARRDYAGIV